MLDHKHKPWLIEVNTNPCLEESSEILKMLLPRMIDDAFKLTLDLVFPPLKTDNLPERDPLDGLVGEGAFEVEGYADEFNMWGDKFYSFRPPTSQVDR